MGPLTGAALSFGASFLSGLFGKSGAEKRAAADRAEIEHVNRENRKAAEKMNREVRARAAVAAKVPIVTTGKGNLSQLVRDAEKNGFNPLTVLRAGGQAFYASTSVTGSTAMDAALAGQHLSTLQPRISQTQVPSTGEVLGKALESGVGTFTNLMSQQQAQQFQMDLTAMQIEGQNRSGYGFGRSFYVPSNAVSGSVGRTGSAPLSSAKPPSDWLSPWINPGIFGDTLDAPSAAKTPEYLQFMGLKWERDPHTTRAVGLEDWYGDDLGWLPMAIVGTSDAIYNARFNPAIAPVVDVLGKAPAVRAGTMIADYFRHGGWPAPTPGDYGKAYDPARGVFQ